MKGYGRVSASSVWAAIDSYNLLHQFHFSCSSPPRVLLPGALPWIPRRAPISIPVNRLEIRG